MIRLVRVTPICAPESWVDRRPQRLPHALGLPVALAGGLLDGGAVDRDEGVLGCPEDPAREHQAHRDPEQQPFHAAHCGGSAPATYARPPRAVTELSARAGNRERVDRRWTGEGVTCSVEVLRCRREPRRTGAQRQRGLRLPRARPACSSPTASAVLLPARSPRRPRRTSSRRWRSPTRRPTRSRLLQSGVRLAQEQIAVGVRRDPARTGMATTLTAVATDGERFGLAHVGDSRGYVFRDGRLTRVTRDHTYVQHLVDEGTLPQEDVAVHPWRNVVLRSVNGDRRGGRRRRSGLRLEVGDRVLLASDGLTDLVTEARDREPGRAPPRRRRGRGAARRRARRRRPRQRDLPAGHGRSTGPTVVAEGALVGAVRDPRNVVDAAAVRMPHSA